MRKLLKLKQLGMLGMLFLFANILNAEEGFRWEKDFNTAVQKATENNQLVLVHFYGNHCPPCRKMDRDIFSRSDLYQTIADYFVPIKVDTSQNPNAVKSLEIVSIPTDIVVTPQGRILYRRVGGTTPEQYLNEILAVAEQYYRDQLQQQGLEQGQGQDTLQHDQHDQQLQQQGLEQQVQQWEEQPNGLDPYSQGERPSLEDNWGEVLPQLPLSPLQSTELYPLQSDWSVETDPFSTSVSSTEMLPESQPTVVQASSVPIPSTVVTQAYHVPNSNVVPSNTQPVSNDSTPHIMYEGYCPVELQDNKRWVLGLSEWTLHYGGADFVFSGKEAMQTFARDPHRYIPVLFGCDVVATFREQQRIFGVRKYGGWFQNRIYLFVSRENYDLFVQNPAYYSEHADKLELHPNQGTR